MVGGFLKCGTPQLVIQEILTSDIKDLTLIANDTCFMDSYRGLLVSHKKLKKVIASHIGTNPETLDYSRKKIQAEIERLKMEFISDSELKNAKDRLKGGLIIALETNAEKASVIGLFETLGLGYDFFNKYVKMIDEVTASDIIRVANKYFNNIYAEAFVK